ncbi:MAG: PQQ-binding-like beta-propeller repeat protein [Verrucomicrobiales bacterium]|nr:PQQ-binding-like beta-propeller repeat protein [Verrucomicrobiales bacterium]
MHLLASLPVLVTAVLLVAAPRSALAAAPTPSPTPNGTLVHWLFSPDRQQGTSIKPVAGGLSVTPFGVRLVDDPSPARAELTAQTKPLGADEDLPHAQLPKQELTVEAWVRVDRPLPLGGLVGVVQHQPETMAGWLLGYRDDSFSFTLASTNGSQPFSTLRTREPYTPGRWYHVVGTYDGREQRLYVNGTLAARDATQSGAIRYPERTVLSLGALVDDDEYVPLSGALHEVLILRRALAASEISARHAARASLFPAPAPEPLWFTPSFGPFVDWKDRTSAVVTWETDTAMPTVLELQAPDGSRHRLENRDPSVHHMVTLEKLAPESEYFYRLHAPAASGREVQTRRYLFDTSFYYAPAPAPVVATATLAAHPEAARLAEQLLQRSSVRRGYCLVLGASDGAVAAELVRQSDLDVVVVESDPARIQAVRQLFQRAGIQGLRASVLRVAPGRLPFGDYVANLIVSERTLLEGTPPAYPAAEIARVLRPSGGVLLLGLPDRAQPAPALDQSLWKGWLADALPEARFVSQNGSWLFHRRGALAGAGEWSHQYGNADNTSCSQDELVRGELQVSWWGDPGPRPMPDRGPRNPAPVSRAGRLFVQGDRVLFGLDAYNGTILWSRSAPELRRANLPRDSSNMAAAGDRLFLAHGRYCLALDGDTGQRVQRYTIPNTPDAAAHDWGYLALPHNNLIVGSRVRSTAGYLGDEGEWYEDFATEQISRVTSDRLFGVDPESGEGRWEYSGGAILNSTITIGDNMIFLIESRASNAVAAAGTRLAPEVLTQTRLVALDLRSGKELWSKDQDFSACQFMTYLVYSRNTVVVTGTDKNKTFHTYAFNAPSPKPDADVNPLASGGQMLWSESHQEDKGHHSGHLQHPVVIDDVFYSDQRAFRLTTGETLRKDLPERRGCGTMSAARHALFFRHHYHSMWDLESDRRTQFEGVRSGCWLTLIPAGGLLLAPESSAGCSCTHPIQTSMGFIPKTTARPGQ